MEHHHEVLQDLGEPSKPLQRSIPAVRGGFRALHGTASVCAPRSFEALPEFQSELSSTPVAS